MKIFFTRSFELEVINPDLFYCGALNYLIEISMPLPSMFSKIDPDILSIFGLSEYTAVYLHSDI
jgi:hypothetical protein